MLADTRIAVCNLRLQRPQATIQILERLLATPAAVRASGLGSEPAFWLGVARWDSGDRERGLAAFEQALAADPTDMGSLYNIACYYASAQPLTALDYLRKAVGAGFFEPEYFDHDPDLDSIRRLPEFQTLAQVVRQRAEAMPKAGPRSKDSIKSVMSDLKRQRTRAKASRLLEERNTSAGAVSAPMAVRAVRCSVR
jgi:tetratricopeptide (TPR) repeat protein